MTDLKAARMRQTADVIAQSVAGRHGEALAPGDLAFLRERLQRAIGILSALDQVRLENSDEPDVVFRVEDDTDAGVGHGR